MLERARNLVVVVLVACASHAPTTRHVEIENGRREAPASAAHVQIGLPPDASLVVAIDLSTVLGIGGIRALAEHMLELGPATLDPSTLGIDPTRPCVVAVAPLDGAQRSALDDLRSVARWTTPSDSMVRAIRKVSGLASTGTVRVVLPAAAPVKLEALLGRIFERNGMHRTAEGYAKSDLRVDMSSDANQVAIDFSDGRARSNVAFDAPLPGLDGRAARGSWSPPDLAAYGFLRRAAEISRTWASGESSTRDDIAQQSFHEAASIFSLATFTRVDVEARLDPFDMVIDATPGPTFVIPTPAAFAPTRSISIEGAAIVMEESGTVALSWTFPGGMAGRATDLFKNARDVRLAGVIGLPHAFAYSPLSHAYSAALPDADLSSFERVEVAFSGTNNAVITYVVVLPKGTPRNKAECFFAPDGACRGQRMKVDAVTTLKGFFAKLVELDHQFVVVTSDNRDAVTKPLGTRSASGLHYEIDVAGLFGGASGSKLPARVISDVSSHDGHITFHAVAAP